MSKRIGGVDYYRFGGMFFDRRHKMDCCSCRYMPDTVCLAHYGGRYGGKYRPELSAAIDNAGNCSRYKRSYRKLVRQILYKTKTLFWNCYWTIIIWFDNHFRKEKSNDK